MRKFGLIGFPLTHSFSKKYFTDIFSNEKISAVYENYPLAHIQEVVPLFQDPLLEGINVTIPYKEAILPYLDEQSEAVQQIGACNCVHIQKGRKIGYNTDVIGFEKTWERKLKPYHADALILGTGGAAKAVSYVLRKRGIRYKEVSRTAAEGKITYADLTAELLSTHTLIINTTPLGMYPNVEACPNIPYEALSSAHYLYDLVYNPAKTLFLQKAEAQGAAIENGQDMLIIQANESRKIWNV